MYEIIPGLIFQPQPKTRGPKKGKPRIDNSKIVHEAAIGVVSGYYASRTIAAKSLKDQYTSHADPQNKITIFVRAITVEIAKIRADAIAEH